MTEWEHFREWCAKKFADYDLASQVDLYLQTFPGRASKLILELVENRLSADIRRLLESKHD